MSKAIAVVRIRGRTHVKEKIADTMMLMGLTRKNYCVLVTDKTGTDMMAKAKDYLTWGPIDEATIEALLKARGKISGDKKLTDSYIKENSKFSTIKALATAISKGEAKQKDVIGLKKVFRLNPPLKGFERGGIKTPFGLGGAIGSRGEKMKDLIMRMI